MDVTNDMKLNNKYIHSPCEIVLDEDFDDAIKIGNEMLKFVVKEKYLSLAANQVGYNKQIVVAKDDDGYDIYFNPEIKPLEISDGLISVTPETYIHNAVLPSFPKKRILEEIYESVEVHAFSVANDDIINFKAEGELAIMWQTMMVILNGVDEQSIVPCDYMTIKGKNKKKPNAICSLCGRKNKKCRCDH